MIEKYKHAFHISHDNKEMFLSSLEIYQLSGVLTGLFIEEMITDDNEENNIIICFSENSLLQRDVWELFPYCRRIDMNKPLSSPLSPGDIQG